MIELRALNPDDRRRVLQQAGRDGADLRRPQRAAAAEGDRALVVRLMGELIAEGLPAIERRWTPSIAAFHVRSRWPVSPREAPPAPSTIQSHLAEAVRLGELSAPATWPINGRPQSP